MAWLFITSDHLKQRLTPALYRRVFDDDIDGDADSDPELQLRRDASSIVASVLCGIYDLDQLATAAADDTAHEIVRVTTDFAEAMSVKRKPAVCPEKNWKELWDVADKSLERLRKAIAKLDTKGPPNPPKNVGGAIYPDPSTTTRRTFSGGGWGDF